MDNNKRLEYLRGLEKLKAAKIKADDYTSPLEQDVMKVKSLAQEIPEEVTRIKGMTEKIDTKGIAPIVSGDDFTKKIEALRALKGAGKKVAGVVPLAGVGAALLSGDPAMAAEELAEDALGPAAVALKSEDAGNRAEEKLMLAERNALRNYKNSPAYRNARGISEDEQDIEELEDSKKPQSTRFSRLMRLFE